jgi:hypothetical protein
MTTIIATPTAIYSDSNVVDSNAVFKAQKIFRFRNRLVGCAGDADMCLAFQEGMRLGRKPKIPPKTDEEERNFNALVVDKKGIWHFDSTFSGDLVLEPFMAVGTGADAARGAMMHGASPEQAVEIACRIDSNSRGPVQVLTL